MHQQSINKEPSKYPFGTVRSAEACVRPCIMTGLIQVTAKQNEKANPTKN